MHKIKTWRNPYDEGFSTCRRKEVEFKPGLTVWLDAMALVRVLCLKI